MTTKEFEEFHDAIGTVTQAVWRIQAKAEAFDTLRQHELASEFFDIAATLHDAIGKLRDGLSAEINGHLRTTEQNTANMLMTLLHFAGKDKDSVQ